jgi:ribosomal protein S15P/S13E
MRQESIHPRVYRGDGVKRNTRKAKNKDVTRRKIAAMYEHLERHPKDAVVQRHVAALEGTL